MTNAELITKIKSEIERRKNNAETLRERNICLDILDFIDTLEESERPEPYNPVYDEAYINEKIKKATESWKGVDVDAMLAECRGYDEEKSEKPLGLEEEAVSYCFDNGLNISPSVATDFARHFAQLGATQAKDESEKPVPNDADEAAKEYARYHYADTFSQELAENDFLAGSAWKEMRMLKDAVEGKVFMSFAPGHNQMVMADVDLPTNTNVRVIVLPKEDCK